MDDAYKRRMVFVHGLASLKYGDRILRGLAAEALDLDKIAGMSDQALIDIPGIGEASVRRVREMLERARTS